MNSTRSVLILVVAATLLAACGPAKMPPVGAIFAAFHFCPVSACDNVEIGRSTTQLPYTESGIYDRWCVEVQFDREGSSRQAAVEVIQVDPNAPAGLGDWIALDPVMNADCGIFE